MNSQIELTNDSFGDYEIIRLKGELTVAEIPWLTPRLQKHIKAHPHKHLILDLADITTMHPGALRLLKNLKLKLGETQASLFLLRPSQAVRERVDVSGDDTTFHQIEACEEVQEHGRELVFDAYGPYGTSEGDYTALSLGCAVCGSHNVRGYLVNTDEYDWRWVDDEPFPTSFMKGTDTPVNVFGMLPVVCRDCFMVSIDLTHFNAIGKGTVAVHSRLDDQSKLILSKSIKERGKTVEQAGEFDREFRCPRDKQTSYLAYVLSEACARAMAMSKVCSDHFMVGYLNYLTIQYAPRGERDTLIGNCRTWLREMLDSKESRNHLDMAKAYFILMNSALHAGKTKEASQARTLLAQLVEGLAPDTRKSSLETPRFWQGQAERIWNNEIQSRSSELKF